MVEIAENLLLFRVDAEHRPGVPLVLPAEAGDAAELLVAVLVVAGRLVLVGLAAREAQFLEQDSAQASS